MTEIQQAMLINQLWIDQRAKKPKYLPNIQLLAQHIIRKSSPLKSRINEQSHHLDKKLRAAQIWYNNVKAMSKISESFGARYLVFLQPTMGLIGPQSKFPKNINSKDAILLRKTLKLPKYLKELNGFYSEAKIYCSKLNYCYDISDVAPPIGNNYADTRHHNANGNKLIAKAIFEKLIEQFGKR